MHVVKVCYCHCMFFVICSSDEYSRMYVVVLFIVECADKNCYDHFRSTHYPPIVNSLQPVQPPKKKQEDILYESVPYTLEEYRLIHEDFTPEQIGLHNDDQRQQDQQQEKDNSAVLLNTVYADSPLLNYTEGVLGMAFSAFDCKLLSVVFCMLVFFILHFMFERRMTDSDHFK